MKAFIAGATGVLGRSLIRQFRERGHSAIGMARSTENENTIRKLGGESRRADLFDADSLARAAEGADVVVHAATAIPTETKPRPEDWKTNDRIRGDGTRALAQAAGRVGAEQFLVQSITWVARPENQSAFDEDSTPHTDFITRSTVEMKTIARDAANREGFKATILRCGWFHAPEAAHTRYFGAQLLARKLPIIGKGDAMWQWIHVEDAASAFVTVAESGRGGLWHVTDDQPVSAGAYLAEFCAAAGRARSTTRSGMDRENSGGPGGGESDDGFYTDFECAVPAGFRVAEWFKILDKAGAKKWPHKEISAYLYEKRKVPAWWCQMVAVGYEHERGLRQKFQKCDGEFSASGSRTMAVPVAKAYAAWTDEKVRSRWLPDAKMQITSATPGKYVRAKWDGDSRVSVGFYSKGAEKTQVAVDHGKLPNSRECARMKIFWFEALNCLERTLKH